MKALILAADGFEDMEFFYPMYRLREEGIEVDVAAPFVGKITGKHGYSFDVRKTVNDVEPSDYDLLVIPGGRAPEHLRVVDRAVVIARRMYDAGKPIAAICHGPQLLISADLVRGRNVTCYEGIRDDVKAAGGKYADKEVVVDGILVTSRTPEDLPAFCRELVKLLKRSEELVGAIPEAEI